MSDLTSGAIATPSCDGGQEASCSGSPPGKRCRQRWNLSVLAVRYTHLPSGDQAPEMHEPLGGPMTCGSPATWNGATRQGKVWACLSSSTISGNDPSGGT